MDMFEEPHNIIPHQIDETVKETTNEIWKDSPSFR